MPAKPLLFTLPLMACLLFAFKTDKKKCSRIVFFGDSITEAGIIPGGYIAQIRDTLLLRGKTKQYDLIGAGIGGNKIYDLYLRLEDDVLSRKPDVVVMYVGVNDVWHKQTFGTGTDPEKFQKFYLALIEKFQKKGIRVIACTPACIGEHIAGQNRMDGDLDRFSEIIRTVTREKNIPLCDLRSAFVNFIAKNNPDNLESGILTTDGVHLNENGNKLVAELILQQL
jgi:isoamyl acetate esterase